MAEIPLLEYVADVEAHLIAGAADEASYHSRHILSRYPKYVPAYRLLGRALLLKGQYDEAEAAFRRVLAAAPADLTAHLGLAELYDQRRRGDEAIWHAERALEIDVTHTPTTELLNALYRRYRGEDRPRVGLTAVTLARTALHNRDYPQAIATLRDLLERQPDKVDQRLLLAEALWESGDHVEAAETASDVLASLPDCLSANNILARLWLENRRPTDARPYLDRLESLDPYRAVALVTGKPVEPDAFTIEPLDYQRSAQSDVARLEPDWIQGLPAEETAFDADLIAPDWSSGLLANAAPPEEEPPLPELLDEPLADDAPTMAVPLVAAGVVGVVAAADWLTPNVAVDDTELPDFDRLTAPTVALPDFMLFDDSAPVEPARDPSVDTSKLDPITDPALDDMMPDLDDLFGESPDASGASVPPFDESALSPGFVPAGGVTAPLPPLDPFAPEPMPPAEDALAWLRESGVELVDDEVPDLGLDIESEFPTNTPADQLDPMAWLNSYDSVLNTEAPAAPDVPAALGDDWQQEAWDPNAVDLNAFTGDLPTSETDLGAAGTTGLRGLTARLNDPGLTPAAQTAPVVDNAMLDEWLSQFDAPAGTQPDSASPGWLNDLGAAMTNEPDSAAAIPTQPGGEPAVPNSDETAAWLNEFSPDALRDDVAVAAGSGNDWLAETNETPDATAFTAEAGLPDWLVEAAPEGSPGMAAALASDPPALDAAPVVDEFDWLDSLNQPVEAAAPELDEAVLAAQADVPDWLTDLESEALSAIDSNQTADSSVPDASVAAPMMALEAVEVSDRELLPFDEASAAANDSESDWLSAGPAAVGVAAAGVVGVAALGETLPQPVENRSEPAASIEDQPAAVASDGAVNVLPAEYEVEPAEWVAEPDAVAPETMAEAEAEAAADWPIVEAATVAFAVATQDATPSDAMSEASSEDWGEPETADLARIAPPTVGAAEIPPIAEMPVAPDDWFVDAALTAEAPVAPDGSLTGLNCADWFADDALAISADQEAAAWESELDAESTLPSVETVAVLAEVTDPEEAVAATEDVLAQEDAGFTAGDALLLGGAATGVGVLALAGADETETMSADAVPLDDLSEDEDWLAGEWPEDAEAPVLQTDELDELPDIEIVEETVIAPATNAPDWLNAMVPGLDMDFEGGDAGPSEDSSPALELDAGRASGIRLGHRSGRAGRTRNRASRSGRGRGGCRTALHLPPPARLVPARDRQWRR